MAETIITEIRGDPLEAKECIFCGETKNCSLFGISAGTRWDGTILRHFGVCTEHLQKINSLLSGKFDIDRIDLERYRKKHVGKGIRLR